MESQVKEQDEPRNKELMAACKANNLEKVTELLEAGANAKLVTTSGENDWYGGNTNSAFFEAVSNFKGDEEKYCAIIELLLKNGANPKFSCTTGSWARSSNSK